MKYAPIILFVYNRLDHTKAVVEALKRCPEAQSSHLFIYSDAEKDKNAISGVDLVRKYIKKIDGFKEVTVIERERNWGIEKNEIDAITSIIDSYGTAIMIEDDIVVGSNFLGFINEGLKKYRDEKKVFSVTGYSFIPNNKSEKLEPFGFTSLSSAWGWATWRDRWQKMVKDIGKDELSILSDNKTLDRFNMGYNYFDMLMGQREAGYYTWDLLWYWTSFVNDGLTLFPTRTMVNNIGMDGTGIHYTNKKEKCRIEDVDYPIELSQLPDMVCESLAINNEIRTVLSKQISSKQIGVISAIKKMVKKMR